MSDHDVKSATSLLGLVHRRLFLQRPVLDLLAIVLLAMVGVVVCLGLMLSHSVAAAFSGSGDDRTMIIRAKGTLSETDSFVMEADLKQFRSVLSSELGSDMPEFEEQMALSTSVEVGNELAFVVMRGLSPEGIRALAGLEIVSGAAARPGRNEVAVGRAIAAVMGLGVGDEIELGRKLWVVSGVFAIEGDVRENDFIADIEQIRVRYDAADAVNSIRVRGAPELFERIREVIDEFAFDLEADVEPEYFRRQSREVSSAIDSLQMLVALLVMPAALAGMLAIQNIQLSGLIGELRSLTLIGVQVGEISRSLLARASLCGLAAGIVGLVVVLLFVRDRTVEIDLGLQMALVRFDVQPLAYATVLGVCLGLAALASLVASANHRLARFL